MCPFTILMTGIMSKTLQIYITKLLPLATENALLCFNKLKIDAMWGSAWGNTPRKSYETVKISIALHETVEH